MARPGNVFCGLSQAHLLSVFDNTRSVTFEEKQYDKIIAIHSQEGEMVPLQEHVMAVVSCAAVIL